MSDFTYKEVRRDRFGRIQYVCECSVCGKECYYARKIKQKPKCWACSYKIDQSKKKNRTKEKAQDPTIRKCAQVLVRSLHDICGRCPVQCQGSGLSCEEAWYRYLKEQIEKA